MKKQDRMLKAKGYHQIAGGKSGVEVTTHKCNNGRTQEIRTRYVKTDKRTWCRSIVIPASSMK